MKKQLGLFAGLFLLFLAAHAQTTDYKVVFDMTSKDTLAFHTLVRQVGTILKANPQAQLEVVIYGGALNLVTKEKSIVEPAIQDLAKKASFKVCEFTMQRHQVDKAQLIPGVQIVPDGIYQIITRQKQGWGYIKVIP